VKAVATDESELERIGQLIAELESEESLLLGLYANPALANSVVEPALLELRERRNLLEEELAEVWAKHCSKC
jgi:hypothetical protein